MSQDQKGPARPPRRGGMMGGGPMGGAMPGEKARDFRGTMKTLVKYVSDFQVLIGIVFLLAACSSMFSILGPKILGKATTKLFEGLMAYAAGLGLLTDFEYIAKCILLLLALYIVSALFSYAQGYLMSGVSMKITYRLRRDISEKMNRMPLRYFDSRTHGEVLSRVTNDVDTVSQTLNQSLTQMITSVSTVAGVLIMMLTISIPLTLVTFLILPLSFSLIMFIVKRSQKHFKKQQEYLGHINGHIEEIYSGHNVVQVFNGEPDAVEKFNGLNDELYDSAWKSQFLSGLMMPVMTSVGNIGYVFVCILGGYLAIHRSITVGDIQAFIQYVRTFQQPISQIANIANTLQSTAAAAERVFEFLSEDEESKEPENPFVPENVEGNVEFRDVTFGYTSDKTVIHHFSSKVEAGQRIAIVGHTGAGKTTIVKLLMRFYDVTEGAILIDGHDIRDFKRSDLRSMFGMVLQDAWLYNDTILENIRYGTFDATNEQVTEAAKAAHCDEFIRALPGGYRMVISEGAGNISQGQKQLLTIARTILSDPKILILDEATSSVDTRTEILIQRAMDNLMKNRTSFVIAHRLSTIKDADLILMMKDGNIVEQGSHDELLRKGGFYAELYQSQFENREAETA